MQINISPAHADPFWVELMSGCGLVCWGGYLWMLDAPLSALPAYDLLSHYIPDDGWSVLTAGIGTMQVIGALRQIVILRWVMAWFGLMAWNVLGVSLFKGDALSLAAPVFCCIAFANIPTIVVLRPRKPHR